MLNIHGDLDVPHTARNASLLVVNRTTVKEADTVELPAAHGNAIVALIPVFRVTDLLFQWITDADSQCSLQP